MVLDDNAILDTNLLKILEMSRQNPVETQARSVGLIVDLDGNIGCMVNEWFSYGYNGFN